MPRRDTSISKAMSHALRHDPHAYGLELDADGSVPLVDLVDALQRAGVAASEDDVHRVVVESDKQRFAVEGDRIRAQYGHSIDERIVKQLIVPQPVLWHATSPAAAESILRDGLLPMWRQYAHLTTDRELAMQAGRRKSTAPVLLRIDAARAHLEGVEFSEGHDRVTLALFVPAQYISAETSRS
ncbi:RNA 2'-phosphotransferase [Curtobacterium flaccumfaciens]|uniref:RNA 2'-phosphotransferase n=1 Tax=Curtobacterium flaccumfaciens TaxID=2035 RepID=UPI0013673BC4|nr:RNA 2'-phosphotransferase [Curtobacterium flaccumfaciens]MBT1665115.1 RNA 2'-phosphotransferase [Curtobacterium flaccumfaciens pv. flaccumfaciens]QFS79836.2 RNA 2'-phosphotransferase [Curtobacterium flaccumfaciens pv. flaccumfaciens]